MPTTINELLWGLAISVTAVIVGHLGAAAVAANSVAQVVRQLATVVCFGIAAAAAVLVGKTIGAGQPELAEQYAKKLIRLTLLMGAVGAVIIVLIRPVVLGVMNLSPEAHDYLSFLLWVMCVYIFGSAYNTTMIVGIFRGGGDTRIGLIIDAVVMWGIALPLGFITAFVLHAPVYVVFLAIFSDELWKVPMCIARYRSRRWLRNVTRSEETLEAEGG